VLVDFGIAKIFDPVLKTTVGARAVTPGYSPPEQYGQGQTDQRSDVYSLGATLYTLLTGQEPPESVERVANNAILIPPRQVAPVISQATNDAILRACEISTTRRYQTMAELRQALKTSLPHPVPVRPAPAQRPTPAPRPTPSPQPTPLPQSYPRGWGRDQTAVGLDRRRPGGGGGADLCAEADNLCASSYASACTTCHFDSHPPAADHPCADRHASRSGSRFLESVRSRRHDAAVRAGRGILPWAATMVTVTRSRLIRSIWTPSTSIRRK